MLTFRNILAAAALGLAVTATPALAMRHQAGTVYNEGFPISAARAAALRTCTAREAQYPDYLWGVTAIQIYRSCMAEHGQME